MKNFKRNTFLEEHPESIRKSRKDRFKAYEGHGSMKGVILLDFSGRVEIYLYDDGPYFFQEEASSLEEAVEIAGKMT